jgi:hypothetical protein
MASNHRGREVTVRARNAEISRRKQDLHVLRGIELTLTVLVPVVDVLNETGRRGII